MSVSSAQGGGGAGDQPSRGQGCDCLATDESAAHHRAALTHSHSPLRTPRVASEPVSVTLVTCDGD